MLSSLSLKSLVCGIGNQLRYVDRFATCRRNHKENVAEHQFYTAFFTLLIGTHIRDQEIHFDVNGAVVKALVHDVEEHYTGDVVRPVKHGNQTTHDGVEKTGADFTRRFFNAISKNYALSNELYMTWRNAKDDTVEGIVVRFADFLSVLAYLDQEVRSGNRLIMDNVNQLSLYFEQFKNKKYDFIRPLVKQAHDLVKHINKEARRIS